MNMNLKYAPGIPGYGTPGKDGSNGLSGLSMYKASFSVASEPAILKYRINNDLILYGDDEVSLPDGRTYVNSDYFIDSDNRIYSIDKTKSPFPWEDTGQKFTATSTLFYNSINGDTQNFKRFSNDYADKNNVGEGKKIIDTVYSNNEVADYTTGITDIYGINGKDWGHFFLTDIKPNNLYYPYFLFNIGTNNIDSFGIIREGDSNLWRIGNKDSGGTQRKVNLALDFFKVLFNNDVSISGNLSLLNGNITDINTIGTYKMVGDINVNGNDINNVKSLSGFKALGDIDMNNKNITNLAELSGFKLTGTLNANSNSLTNIASISTNGTLNMNYRTISNVGSIQYKVSSAYPNFTIIQRISESSNLTKGLYYTADSKPISDPLFILFDGKGSDDHGNTGNDYGVGGTYGDAFFSGAVKAEDGFIFSDPVSFVDYLRPWEINPDPDNALTFYFGGDKKLDISVGSIGNASPHEINFHGGNLKNINNINGFTASGDINMNSKNITSVNELSGFKLTGNVNVNGNSLTSVGSITMTGALNMNYQTINSAGAVGIQAVSTYNKFNIFQRAVETQGLYYTAAGQSIGNPAFVIYDGNGNDNHGDAGYDYGVGGAYGDAFFSGAVKAEDGFIFSDPVSPVDYLRPWEINPDSLNSLSFYFNGVKKLDISVGQYGAASPHEVNLYGGVLKGASTIDLDGLDVKKLLTVRRKDITELNSVDDDSILANVIANGKTITASFNVLLRKYHGADSADELQYAPSSYITLPIPESTGAMQRVHFSMSYENPSSTKDGRGYIASNGVVYVIPPETPTNSNTLRYYFSVTYTTIDSELDNYAWD